MAAARGKQPTQVQKPQEILTEVRKFIRGANYDGKISSEELGQSALYLLRSLPAARHAVLEYLCNVFTESVNSHLNSLHNETSNIDVGPKYDNIIQNATGVLLGFVRSNPSAWAQIISSWSLGLLGEMSFTKRGAIHHSDSLNEVLQLWMTCSATKALIEIATECFDVMVSGAPDVCVDSLLEASVKYSPYFDWVVAHIGSCFPKTIITRVLMCGLKDFCSHGGSQSEPTTAPSEDKTPKMASVVGILGHLASKHGQDIRLSLMHLFQESLQTDKDAKKLSTVPFLLQLASMSPMLLQVLTTDFLKALTPDVLNRLHQQFSLWNSLKIGDYDSLLSLVVHLVMKSEVGALEVLRFLLNVAVPLPRQPASLEVESYNPAVQSIAVAVLNQLTVDLQKAVFNRRQNSTVIPFLRALADHCSDVTRDFLQSDGERSEGTCRILGYVCLYNDTGCAAEVLAQVISQSKTAKQRSKFLHLQMYMETRLSKVLPLTVEKIVDHLEPKRDANKSDILMNILYVVKWEKRSTTKNVMPRSILHKALQGHITLLALLLNHPDNDVALLTLELIQVIGIPNPLPSEILLRLSNSFTSILFRAFGNKKSVMVGKVQRLCMRCVKMLCVQPCAQSLILKGLIEGATAPDTRELFGGKINLTNAKVSDNQSSSLFGENCKHGVSMTLPQSHSSVFHAGIIGKGLKPRQKNVPFTKDLIQRNRNYFLEILWLASCSHENAWYGGSGDIGEIIPGPSPTLGRKIASLFVHLLTPDVLYNSIAWPGEDFMRVTIERDLYVWRQFEENPILLDIVELLSVSQMFMCFCSPLLRSLTAALIIHFENSRDKSARNSPKHLEVARRVLYCLKRGNLLPFPLSNVGEIFSELSPYEVHLLLLNTWRYIKENPPRLDGPPGDCDVRYLEVLRAILHKNISVLGHHYCLMVDVTVETDS